MWVAKDFGGLDVFEEVHVDVPAPGPGEVTIGIRAAGMNPADYKHVANGSDRSLLPVPIGYECAGVVTAVGPDTRIGSGPVEVGDEVLAFRISGGYATERTVAAKDVFAKPGSLSFEQAASLLLVSTTAAEMLDVTGVRAGDIVLLHGASGSVGVAVLQLAAAIGARVIGTCAEQNSDLVRRFGGEPVVYGPGLEERVRALAPEGVDAALDAVGTDEAIDVSLALVADPARIVTIAAMARAAERHEGFRVIAGAMPASAAFRDETRPRLIEAAGRGELVIPIAQTFPLSKAREALEVLAGQHPGGKLVLVP